MGKYHISDLRGDTSQRGSKAVGHGPSTLLPPIATELAQAWAARAACLYPPADFWSTLSDSVRRNFFEFDFDFVRSTLILMAN